jgi:hypothetical protein
LFKTSKCAYASNSLKKNLIFDKYIGSVSNKRTLYDEIGEIWIVAA